MDDEKPVAIDQIAPWTIKAFSVDARRRIVRAAEIEGVTVGQWIERRLEDWEAAGGNQVANPVILGAPQAQIQQEADRVVSLVAVACQLATTRGVPQTVRKTANETVERSLRAFGGALGEASGPSQLVLEAPRHVRRQPAEIAGGDETQQTLEGASVVEAEHG